MTELFNLIDKLFNFIESLGVIGVIGLMWAIALVIAPIVQIVEYHVDCKKYGKEYTDEMYRRM